MNKVKIYPAVRWDKRSKKMGTYPINFIVRFGGKSIKFPTEYAVTKNNWDEKKSLPKDDRLSYLIKKKIELFEKWKFENDVNDKTVTEILIREFFAGENHKNFLDYYERKLATDISLLEKNTVKGYRTNINALREFKPEILFSDIDLKFIEDFNRFLTNKGLKDSGRYGHDKNLKAVLNRAKREKLIKVNPYGEGFVMPKVSARTEWLTGEEIRRIENLKLPVRNAGLLRTKHLFLFSCYTGLRYSDIVSLERKDIKKVDGYWMIEKEQVKTRNKVVIPLTDKAMKIVNLFKGVSDTVVFENVSNQNLNYNLKTLMNKAKIKKVVTFHIARHSFASVAVSKGVDLYPLSKMMGHKSIKMTERYAKLDTKTLIEAMDVMAGKRRAKAA